MSREVKAVPGKSAEFQFNPNSLACKSVTHEQSTTVKSKVCCSDISHSEECTGTSSLFKSLTDPHRMNLTFEVNHKPLQKGIHQSGSEHKGRLAIYGLFHFSIYKHAL